MKLMPISIERIGFDVPAALLRDQNLAIVGVQLQFAKAGGIVRSFCGG